MHSYGVRDVERLLGVTRAAIRALVGAGFVTPARGPRNGWRFSFQDLIVLRTAQALAAARVPQRRITKSVRELRKRLPASMPLSGLAIGAVGDRVVVREGARRWQADSGQYLLEFGGDPADGSLTVIERGTGAKAAVRDPFAEGLALERDDPEAAMRAYRQAIADDPANLDARINLGLLLHEANRLPDAGRIYSDALQACGADAVLLFNLGVLLEDMGDASEAERAYRAALAVDPGLADGHYNLALLCRGLGKPREAIRHMAAYRRLTR